MSATPVIISGICLALGLLLRLWKRRLPVLSSKWYLIGAALALPLALTFFALGLDDNADYLRLKHGMWHVMISLTGFFVVRAFNPDVVVAERREFMLGCEDRKRREAFFVKLSRGSTAPENGGPEGVV